MAAAASPAPSASTAEVAAARWSAALFRPRLVDLDVSASHFFSIQRRNRLFCFLVAQHFNEPEAACPACLPVHRQMDTAKLAKRFKKRPQVAFRSPEAQISDE